MRTGRSTTPWWLARTRRCRVRRSAARPLRWRVGLARRDDGAVSDQGGDRTDEEQLAAYATELADGIEAALPGWVEAQVARIVVAWTGAEPDEAVRAEAARAGLAASDELGPQVRALLARDIDEQRGNPMNL